MHTNIQTLYLDQFEKKKLFKKKFINILNVLREIRQFFEKIIKQLNKLIF